VARCHGLSMELYGGEVCRLYSLWLVLLESAKNRFLGVDPLGQHVPPRVQYGTTCSLIMIASENVPCSVVQRRVHGVLKNCMVSEGPL
jgi:hypothetical protein